ncbi:uncharacterized protein BXZ73DRAFT_6288, partial [Epithele typhae]|uniref:uncharacterized protein n=1 Tax=Epithele typhae TaxID=378194 RepID=UPI0020089E7C
VYDVPACLQPARSLADDLDHRRARARYDGAHIARWIVGPMPPSLFIDTFLPRTSEDQSESPSMMRAFSKVPQEAESSEPICRTMLAALRHKKPNPCPGFVFEKTPMPDVHLDASGPTKPSISCYKSQNHGRVQGSDKALSVKFGYTELLFDISPQPAHDFFVDPPARLKRPARQEFLSHSDSKRKQTSIEELFGQHLSYATEVFARQQRVFIFTVLMYGSLARLLRWDRSGCVVTRALDVRAEADVLCTFLWRFSHASDAGRGHDTSVGQVNSEDEALFADAIRGYVRSQIAEGEDLEQVVKQHYSPHHVYSTHVLQRQSPMCEENTRRFLFSRPAASSSSVTGRGTRGYWALDVATGKVVFVKDTWRDSPLADVEGDILQQLNEAGVSFVPSFVWHGDVSSLDEYPEGQRPLRKAEIQSTVTNTLCEQKWVCRVNGCLPRISQRRHYRLVMGTVGMPMSTLRGTAELLHATHDVFTAMREASAKDNRIHRDISVGNIVLVKEADADIRRGYLIDWETSCKINEHGEAIEVGRVGTWRFMSIRVL